MILLDDVQGLILRSYGMDCSAFFLLRVGNPALARKSLGALGVTKGTPWSAKPDFCVNIGFTFDGLAALGLPQPSLVSFPEEFTAGAYQRCAPVGDTKARAPPNWGFGVG